MKQQFAKKTKRKALKMKSKIYRRSSLKAPPKTVIFYFMEEATQQRREKKIIEYTYHIYGKMKQYRNEMAIIVLRQRIFHCLNNGCVFWARILEGTNETSHWIRFPVFIASIKADPFRILITSRIFHFFHFLLLFILSFLMYVYVCVHMYIVWGTIFSEFQPENQLCFHNHRRILSI